MNKPNYIKTVKNTNLIPEIEENNTSVGYISLLQSGSYALKEGEDKYNPSAKAGRFLFNDEVFKSFDCQVIDVQSAVKEWPTDSNRPIIHSTMTEAKLNADPASDLIPCLDFLVRLVNTPLAGELGFLSFDLAKWSKKTAAIKWRAEIVNFCEENSCEMPAGIWTLSSRLDKSKGKGESFSWYTITSEYKEFSSEDFYKEAPVKLEEVKALMAGRDNQEDIKQLAESHGI